ncbi:MAG TPA: tetratricopeptide repeat protein, partial [Methanotrichaceae archaeon]|nr:tetratricopeptide repeat protein [Methanotrichaceae archaeon]
MDQLIVLQEIYESFSKGREVLHTITPRSVTGSCAGLVGQLLEDSKKGEIDEEICQKLAECLKDAYEIKRLGDICRQVGILDLALECYNKSMSLSQDQNFRPVLYNNLGQVVARQGDLAKAAAYYKKAADGFDAIGDRSGMAHVLGNLGSAYRRSYDWEKAIDYCYKSLKAFEDLKDEFGMAQMTGSLGRIYAEMGERDLAQLYYERCLKAFEGLGDKRSAAWVLERLGRIKAETRAWDESIRHFNRSISIFDDLGQPQSSGIVLSNMGRMYLDKAELSAARDALERSLKQMRRDMHPVYQNAIASLAATYSIMGRKYLQQAIGYEKPAKKPEELVRLSYQYYAKASDRFTELSSFPGFALPEIKVAASIARSMSYMSRLQDGCQDDEAVALSERATSALDGAIANSSGREKNQLEALKRNLTGMRGVWAIGLSRNEPWKMMRSVAEAIEYLMGGAPHLGDGCPIESYEACKCLFDGLQSLSGAVMEESRRRDPSEQIRSASSHLRRAEKRFDLCGTELGRESAFLTSKASKLLDKLVEAGTGSDQPEVADLLGYRAHRSVLLLIGWVLVKNSLSGVDRTDWIYAWDGSLTLIESGPAGLPEMRRLNKAARIDDLVDCGPASSDQDQIISGPSFEMCSAAQEVWEAPGPSQSSSMSGLASDRPVYAEAISMDITVASAKSSDADDLVLEEFYEDPYKITASAQACLVPLNAHMACMPSPNRAREPAFEEDASGKSEGHETESIRYAAPEPEIRISSDVKREPIIIRSQGISYEHISSARHADEPPRQDNYSDYYQEDSFEADDLLEPHGRRAGLLSHILPSSSSGSLAVSAAKVIGLVVLLLLAV